MTPFNLALFVLLVGVLEYFFLQSAQLIWNDFPYLAQTGEILLAAFVCLLALESALVFKLDRSKSKSFLTPLLLTHLPWFLGAGVLRVTEFHLPDPHNFYLRKIQLLLGLMWITHLFVFCAWLLWRTRENKHPLPKTSPFAPWFFWRAPKNKSTVSQTFAWVSMFFFIGVTLYTTQCDLSGDEPHYLLMAYSLIHDGDLDLTNNYQNRDYEAFYHRGTLEPQGLEHVVNGKRYSHHPLGPVLAVLPGYALLGRLGAALTISLLTALALFLTLRILELTGAKGWPLQAVGTIGLFSSPFLLFSGLIFPEIPTACLTVLSLYLFLRKRWVWFGIILGLFLWMHNRNVLLVIPLLLAAAHEIWKSEKFKWEKMGWLAAGFGIPVILLALYFYCLYGVWTPLGAHNEPFTSLFPLSHFWIGFFGLLFDQECGLWFHFPIFAVAVTGGVLLWRSRNPLRLPVIITFAFYYLSMSFYENLGLTPATRYMVGVTPLLLFAIYPVLERMKRFYLWEALTLFSFTTGVLINWILAVIPWMRYNKLEGENLMLKTGGNLLGIPLPSLEPSFQSAIIPLHSYVLSAVWILVTIGLTVLFIKESSARKRW